MKRLILVALCAALMMLATGCEGWFNSFPKDTVMKKKITKEHQTNEVEYEGVLSQDSVKTLSLNAVNKYYNENLKMDELQFELMSIDQNKLKELLQEAHYVTPKQQLNPQLSFDYKTELDHIPGGLYYVTLTSSTDLKSIYDIVLNARDGDVMKISKTVAARVLPSAVGEKREKVFDVADRFVEEKGSYPLDELTFEPTMINWGSSVVEMYYTSKDRKSIKYCVMINASSNEIIGFSKDVMALLSYSKR
ncbi:hypothetical protein [Cohnella abietis]|nr:hypothetical protein [Cohnella abietis]